jgi:hypothetical protein
MGNECSDVIVEGEGLHFSIVATWIIVFWFLVHFISFDKTEHVSWEEMEKQYHSWVGDRR